MMCSTWKRMALVVIAIMVVAIVAATSAQADPVIPGITNGNFTDYTGSAPKDSFTSVKPVDWSGGSGLIFIDSSTYPNTPDGPKYLQVYGPFPAAPLPGNFVEADGNPSFGSSFSYQLHGLTPGTTYQLSFFQAGGQQTGFGNGLNTKEQWIVGLGTAGFQLHIGAGPVDPYYGGNDSTYSFIDTNESVQATPVMTTPSGGVTPWEQVTVHLTADASNDLLTFLAWGDNGSTVNLPPIAFLDIANDGNPVAAPEPASLTLMVIGMFGFGAYRLRRRRSNSATV
jgi:hypothetical protein